MKGKERLAVNGVVDFLNKHYDIIKTSKGVQLNPKDPNRPQPSYRDNIRSHLWDEGFDAYKKDIILAIDNIAESLNKRFALYWKSKGKRQVDLEKAGYASKQTISNIWHGKRKPGCEFLERFVAENKDLNVRWLFTGIGEMIDKGDPASEVMVKFLSDRLEKVEEENKELNREIGRLKAEYDSIKNHQIDNIYKNVAEDNPTYKKKK